MKKFLAILLSTVMTLCFSSAAFAAEGDPIPEGLEKHVIELAVAPGETTIDPSTLISGEDAIAPCIWGDPSMSIIDHYSANTSSFYVSDKYFAYEMEAIPSNGVATSQGYCVELKYVNAGTIASMSGEADGSNYKLDWITINVDGNYYFRVTNDTDYVLNVYLTYYSWN